MARKITLTVPDELGGKIDQWRGRINLSEVFREAMAARIEREERFLAAMQGGNDMEAVIERLKKEKIDLEGGCRDQGREEGQAWGMAADYKSLVYAVKLLEAKGSVLRPDVEVSDLFQDPELGFYFQERLDEDPILAPESYGDNLADNPAASKWLEGWALGLADLWDQVKDKL